MSKRAFVRAVIALSIAVVVAAAYSIVARNQANSTGVEAPSGFLH